MTPFIPPERFPPIIGRKQAAVILAITSNPNNMERLPGLPESLQQLYGEDVIGVDQTPLYFRDEIEEYAAVHWIDIEKRRADAKRRAKVKRAQARAAQQVPSTT